MSTTVIENQLIRLRETTPKDVDWVLSVERDPANRDFVYNWTKARHLKCIASSDEKHFVIESIENDTTENDAKIGYIILSGLTSEHEVISFDRITIARKGRGYGRQAIRLIKKLCFEQYGCHRLWLDVFDFNPHARALYESEGFILEGTLRECKKICGEYLTMHVLSMLAQEYKQ
jgi:diamine N-acetyltransferase